MDMHDVGLHCEALRFATSLRTWLANRRSDLTSALRSFTLRNFIEDGTRAATSYSTKIAKLYASQLH